MERQNNERPSGYVDHSAFEGAMKKQCKTTPLLESRVKSPFPHQAKGDYKSETANCVGKSNRTKVMPSICVRTKELVLFRNQFIHGRCITLVGNQLVNYLLNLETNVCMPKSDVLVIVLSFFKF